MEEGFILSNKFRKIIFEEIANGEGDIEVISRKNHLLLKIAREVAEELVGVGVIKKENDVYRLTKEGERVFEKLRGR